MRLTPVSAFKPFVPRFSGVSGAQGNTAPQPDAASDALPPVLSQNFGHGVYGQEIFVNAALAIQELEEKTGSSAEISLHHFISELGFLRARIVRGLKDTQAGTTQPETFFYPTESKTGFNSYTFPAISVPQRALASGEEAVIRTQGQNLNPIIKAAVNGLVEAGLLSKRAQLIIGDKISLTPNGRLVLKQIEAQALEAALAAQREADRKSSTH